MEGERLLAFKEVECQLENPKEESSDDENEVWSLNFPLLIGVYQACGCRMLRHFYLTFLPPQLCLLEMTLVPRRIHTRISPGGRGAKELTKKFRSAGDQGCGPRRGRELPGLGTRADFGSDPAVPGLDARKNGDQFVQQGDDLSRTEGDRWYQTVVFCWRKTGSA